MITLEYEIFECARDKHELNDPHSEDTEVDFVSDAIKASRDGGAGPQNRS
jgi:hypothetical protein